MVHIGIRRCGAISFSAASACAGVVFLSHEDRPSTGTVRNQGAFPMIAIAHPSKSCPTASNAHDQFLEMLPTIREQARLAFHSSRPEAREDLIAETVANAFCIYQRLVDRGKQGLAFPTPLAWYAIKRARAGRRVGRKLNVRDITSEYCQHQKAVFVERLDLRDSRSGAWQEILVEDRHAGPDEIAAARIDVRDWLKSLPKRNRSIAEKLATGESTSFVARLFGMTPGRVSQLRRELENAWLRFQSEPVPATL
jgi:hypothetical protein